MKAIPIPCFKYKIGQNVTVEFSRENAEYYNGNPLASWPFYATITDYKDEDYLVEAQDNEFFTVTESEISKNDDSAI